MSEDAPLASFEFGRGELAGSHLSLFHNRLVHGSADYVETLPLDRIGSVRIAFERDGGRLTWGWILFAIAVMVFAASWPLRMLVGAALGEVMGQAQGGGFLPAALRALDACVAALPFASVAVALWGIAWIALGWTGATVLTVLVGPSERIFASRGRDPALQSFAEGVAAHVVRKG